MCCVSTHVPVCLGCAIQTELPPWALHSGLLFLAHEREGRPQTLSLPLDM